LTVRMLPLGAMTRPSGPTRWWPRETVKPGHRAVYYVDDGTNTLNLLHR